MSFRDEVLFSGAYIASPWKIAGIWEVGFFGGEPLVNFTVLQDIVAYGRERGCETGKEFKFTLTTNALLLYEKVTQYLNDQNIKCQTVPFWNHTASGVIMPGKGWIVRYF